jgi:amino acid transporter
MTMQLGPSILLRRACLSLMVLGVMPIVSLLLALGLAAALGCQLSEGETLPCVVMGVDLENTLLLMAIGGMLIVYTLPVGAAALVIWLAAWMWQRRRREA